MWEYLYFSEKSELLVYSDFSATCSQKRKEKKGCTWIEDAFIEPTTIGKKLEGKS
jgi:hypothetical protein